MTPIPPGSAAFRVQVDGQVFVPGADLWPWASTALRCVRFAMITLPDRGPAASADELPPEYYRFPPF